MEIKYMEMALLEAKKAMLIDEVPIGAVVVKDGKVIARAHNKKVATDNSLGHAELIAITKASKKLGWRLIGCDIYVTLEPCAMCAGAIINSRIENVYFGAYDDKAGCCGTLYNLPVDTRFNHRANVIGGVMEEECKGLLKQFFQQKRQEHKKAKKNKLYKEEDR